ncbi:MAG: zinc-ribbon domain-containing protein [Anaerolineae bacterium]
MATCPNCGNTTLEGAIFCDQCGTRLPQPEAAAPAAAPVPAGGSVICPACGAGNVPGEAFCDFCGSPLEPPVPTVEAVPDLEPVSQEAELVVATEPAASPAAAAPPAAEDATPTAAAAPPAAQEPVAAAAEELTCPACGEPVSADEAFCASCGASLALAPIPPEPVPEVEPEPAAAVEAEPVAAEAPAPPAPAGPPTCPACGTEVEAGDAFCSTCGYALQALPAPVKPAEAPAAPPVAAPVAAGPRLVIVDSGAEIPLPAEAEILVGREDPVSGIYPQVDLTPHGGEEGGVSRQHARIIVEGGSYFVEDLDSTNFTFVNKQKLAPKTRQPVADGDEIRFGRITAVLRTGS